MSTVGIRVFTALFMDIIKNIQKPTENIAKYSTGNTIGDSTKRPLKGLS
jgi:hypothetical protein